MSRRPPPAGAVVLDLVLPAAIDDDPPAGSTPAGYTPTGNTPAGSTPAGSAPVPSGTIAPVVPGGPTAGEAPLHPLLLRSFCERPTGKEPKPWAAHACVLRLEELAAFLQASKSCIVSGEGITASTTSARYTTPRCRVPRQHSYLLTYYLQAAAAYLTPADPPNFSGVRSLAQALKGTRACCS